MRLEAEGGTKLPRDDESQVRLLQELVDAGAVACPLPSDPQGLFDIMAETFGEDREWLNAQADKKESGE